MVGIEGLWAEEQEMDRGGEMEAMGYVGGKAETCIQRTGNQRQKGGREEKNIHRGARGTDRAICYMETHIGKKGLRYNHTQRKCEAPLIFQVLMHNILLLNNIRDLFSKIFDLLPITDPALLTMTHANCM